MSPVVSSASSSSSNNSTIAVTSTSANTTRGDTPAAPLPAPATTASTSVQSTTRAVTTTTRMSSSSRPPATSSRPAGSGSAPPATSPRNSAPASSSRPPATSSRPPATSSRPPASNPTQNNGGSGSQTTPAPVKNNPAPPATARPPPPASTPAEQAPPADPAPSPTSQVAPLPTDTQVQRPTDVPNPQAQTQPADGNITPLSGTSTVITNVPPSSTLPSQVSFTFITLFTLTPGQIGSSTIVTAPPLITELSTGVGAGGELTTLTNVVANPTNTALPDHSPSARSGFFANQGAVAGVFLVVGMVVMALLGCLFWQVRRRRRFNRQLKLNEDFERVVRGDQTPSGLGGVGMITSRDTRDGNPFEDPIIPDPVPPPPAPPMMERDENHSGVALLGGFRDERPQPMRPQRSIHRPTPPTYGQDPFSSPYDGTRDSGMPFSAYRPSHQTSGPNPISLPHLLAIPAPPTNASSTKSLRNAISAPSIQRRPPPRSVESSPSIYPVDLPEPPSPGSLYPDDENDFGTRQMLQSRSTQFRQQQESELPYDNSGRLANRLSERRRNRDGGGQPQSSSLDGHELPHQPSALQQYRQQQDPFHRMPLVFRNQGPTAR